MGVTKLETLKARLVLCSADVETCQEELEASEAMLKHTQMELNRYVLTGDGTDGPQLVSGAYTPTEAAAEPQLAPPFVPGVTPISGGELGYSEGQVVIPSGWREGTAEELLDLPPGALERIQDGDPVPVRPMSFSCTGCGAAAKASRGGCVECTSG